MRLIYICRNCTLDNGHSRLAWELAQQAHAEGHQVHLIARRFPAGFKTNGAFKFHRVFQLPKVFGQWRSRSFAWFSSRTGRQLAQPGVVHGFGDSFYQDVVTIGNVDWNYPKRIPNRRSSLSALRIKKAAIGHAQENWLVIVSRQLKKDILELFPNFNENRLKVIYPGVHLDSFHPSRKQGLREHLAASFGIPREATWLVSAAGGDFEKRNLATLAQSLLAMKRRTDWVFLFAGAKAGEVAWPSELASRSYFLGLMKELSDVLPACDLFVYPAWFDEFAMVCLEAMASGLPLVVSPFVGASEILPEMNKEFGLLPHPADAESLARQVTIFLQNAALREKVAHANRKAAEGFSWQSTYRQYAELYQEVWQRHPNRGPL